MSIELSLVIPTYNEKGNIQTLLGNVDAALKGVEWEAIFVDDDSPDGTAESIREIAKGDSRVRCVQRIGRRGLSSACIEGMLSTSAPYIAVMDADLQHDAMLLIKMLEMLRSGALDIVVGSRYVEGGNFGDWTFKRVMMSRFATRLSRLVIKADLKDPMSGYFMLKRSFFHEVVRSLSGKGFKILLDIFASAKREIRFKELPFQFGQRLSGESKLTQVVLFEYVMLIVDKLLGKFLPTRFVLFVLVGLSGVAVHLAVLTMGLKIFQYPFMNAQIAATFAAMTSNFYFNNIFTFSELRLKKENFFKGLLSFYVACGIGAAVNICLATFLFKTGIAWWIAGLAGSLVGSVLNFSISATLTWRESNK